MSGSKRERKGEIYSDLQSREGRSPKVTPNKNLKDMKESSGLGAGCPREGGGQGGDHGLRKHEAGRLKGMTM